MGRWGVTEILILVALVCLLLAAMKLSVTGQGLAGAARNLRRGLRRTNAAPTPETTRADTELGPGR